MATGKVKWFSAQKGYGFVVPADGAGDVFVHHSKIVMEGFRELSQGDSVEYDVSLSPKGLEASNVRKQSA